MYSTHAWVHSTIRPWKCFSHIVSTFCRTLISSFFAHSRQSSSDMFSFLQRAILTFSHTSRLSASQGVTGIGSETRSDARRRVFILSMIIVKRTYEFLWNKDSFFVCVELIFSLVVCYYSQNLVPYFCSEWCIKVCDLSYLFYWSSIWEESMKSSMYWLSKHFYIFMVKCSSSRLRNEMMPSEMLFHYRWWESILFASSWVDLRTVRKVFIGSCFTVITSISIRERAWGSHAL